MSSRGYGSLPSSVGSPFHEESGDSYASSDGYLSRSLGSSSLVSPIIGDEEVEVGSLRRSRTSLDRRRAQLAVTHLATGSSAPLAESLDDDWFQVDNPLRRESHLTTDLQTFIHLLKGNVGTGLLAIPLAVKNAGYVPGIVGLILLGIISTHCMLVLVKCSQVLGKKHNIEALNYAEVMKFALLERFSKKLLGKIGLYVVNVFLTVTQFGFCSVYFVFIGNSLHNVFEDAFNIDISVRLWIVIVLPLIILCCWIRDLDSLTPFSLIANLCIVFSIVVILYEITYELTSENPDEEASIRQEPLAIASGTTFALYFGTVVYAFEGIGMVLPLENKMKIRSHFKPIIITGMTVIVLTYCLFGLLGYLTYGENICPSITLNLRSQRLAAQTVFIIVQLYYAYVIFASYMLQFYVPMDFLEIPFFKMVRLEHHIDKLMYYRPQLHGPVYWLVQTAFRTLLVSVTAGLAMAIPDLNGLITLIGAVASCALAFIFPPFLNILTFWNERPPLVIRVGKLRLSLSWWFIVVKDVAILLLGVLGSIFGTYASIASIVGFFEKQHDLPPYCDAG